MRTLKEPEQRQRQKPKQGVGIRDWRLVTGGKAATWAALKNYKVQALGIPWRANLVVHVTRRRFGNKTQRWRQVEDKAKREREDEIC